MGNRPSTIEMKIANGTFRKHKHGGADLVPKPSRVEDLVAPESLGELGLELWNLWFPELVGLGIITVVDVPAFTQACELADKIADLDRHIEKGGWTYLNDKSGAKIANPHIAIRQKYVAEQLNLLDRFGLVPVSRQKIQIKQPKPVKEAAARPKFQPLSKQVK